jgi:2-dehydropantoate 2-reductase
MGKKIKITIIGPGSIGILIGSFFLRDKNLEIFFLHRDREKVEKIKTQGISVKKLNGKSEKFSSNLFSITENEKEIGKCELIIVAVKAHQTKEILKKILNLIDENTYVITLQNGLGNIENLKKVVPENKIIGGITSYGAYSISCGNIVLAGEGETIIGSISKENQREILRFKNLFNRVGFKTKITSNIEGALWSKFLINIGINPLASVLDVHNGYLIEDKNSRKILEYLVKEGWEIAKKKGVKLLYPDPVKKVKEVCKLTYYNINSTLQDIRNKRKTEIDFLNGIVVKEGEKLKINVPVNLIFYNLIKFKEKNYL